jgi:hypothetical protein
MIWTTAGCSSFTGGIWTDEGDEEVMRVLILALSVLGIFISADAAKGGPSTTNRELSAPVDRATFTDEATQETEDQIGLDKGKPARRRDGGGAHHHRSGGGPGGLIGGMMGGLFGHR